MSEPKKHEAGKHIKTVVDPFKRVTPDERCSSCQTSCQSACKTSCTVGNQVCPR
ncbi:MAG: six-cysteine ranthipeptide SCIFF [Bacillota bacterium]